MVDETNTMIMMMMMMLMIMMMITTMMSFGFPESFGKDCRGDGDNGDDIDGDDENFQFSS